MNKIMKGAMYMGGTMMVGMASYYAGLPKDKKEDMKNKMMNMMKKSNQNEVTNE